MVNTDIKIKALETEVKKLTQALQVIGRKVEYLERENNRRKQESNQVASVLRKG